MLFKTLRIDVYRWLRESEGLSRKELAGAAGLSPQTIQRIELGQRVPRPSTEAAILKATNCSRLFFAELLCKSLSVAISRRVLIDPQLESRYDATTPLAEAHSLLEANHDRMPRELWRSWVERLRRVKALSAVLDQEVFAIVRDVEAHVKALGGEDRD